MNDWDHLDEELQNVINNDIETSLACPMCGETDDESYTRGTQYESQCCRFMFVGFQKSDYLNNEQRMTFSMANVSYPSVIENAMEKLGRHFRNESIKEMVSKVKKYDLKEV